MGFIAAIRSGYRRYGRVHGRARRSEYWWFQLFVALAALPTSLLVVVMWGLAFDGTITGPEDDPVLNPDAVDVGWLTAAFAVLLVHVVAFVVPLYTVGARRLHDVGQSGWWLLLAVLGLGIVPLIMCVIEGQRGSNRYGPDPRLVAEPISASP